MFLAQFLKAACQLQNPQIKLKHEGEGRHILGIFRGNGIYDVKWNHKISKAIFCVSWAVTPQPLQTITLEQLTYVGHRAVNILRYTGCAVSSLSLLRVHRENHGVGSSVSYDWYPPLTGKGTELCCLYCNVHEPHPEPWLNTDSDAVGLAWTEHLHLKELSRRGWSKKAILKDSEQCW